MAQAWSIKIVPGSELASFVPDVYIPPGTDSSGALRAQAGDEVSWNNQTSEEHQPWLADAEFKPVKGDTNALTGLITPWDSSTPGYLVPAATIHYCCALHPDEHGTIEVVA